LSQKRRQLMLLFGLLALLGFVVLRSLAPGWSLGSRGGRGRAEGAELGVSASAVQAVEQVDLAALDPQPGAFSPGRDPFRFSEPPRPAAPPPPPPPAPRPAQQREAPQTAQRQQTPPKPRPPAIDFRYLGSFGPKERKIAVFIDESEIYNARQGDVVKDRFLVVNIGFESADIGFVEFPSEPAQRLAAGG
jgi:hypothetical protein